MVNKYDIVDYKETNSQVIEPIFQLNSEILIEILSVIWELWVCSVKNVKLGYSKRVIFIFV